MGSSFFSNAPTVFTMASTSTRKPPAQRARALNGVVGDAGSRIALLAELLGGVSSAGSSRLPEGGVSR